jgi:hypothetical protein
MEVNFEFYPEPAADFLQVRAAGMWRQVGKNPIVKLRLDIDWNRLKLFLQNEFLPVDGRTIHVRIRYCTRLET